MFEVVIFRKFQWVAWIFPELLSQVSKHSNAGFSKVNALAEHTDKIS